jgi:hypothetical protein
VDFAGAVYISDSGNNRLRKVVTGQISTIAGTGRAEYSGDGGPATAATVSYLTAMAFDTSMNAYLADSGNYRISKASPATITALASHGTAASMWAGHPRQT